MKRKKVTVGADGLLEGMKRYKEAILKSREPAKVRAALYPALTFVLSLLLSMVRVPMGAYPLGFAVVGASSGTVGTLSAFLGAAIGGSAAVPHGIAYLAALFSILAVRVGICFIKGDFRVRPINLRRLFRERGYIRVVLAAGGAAALGCITVLETESIYYGLFSALIGIGASALSAAAFIFLSDKSADRSKRTAGIGILAMGLTASLSLFAIPFSIGAVFAFFAALYFSYTKNVSLGCIVGFACGITLGGQYGAVFGSCALVSALLWEYSRAGAVVLSGLCAGVLSLFCAGLDALSDVIPEISLAAAIAAPLFSSGIVPSKLPAFLDIDKSGISLWEPQRRKLTERYSKIGSSLDSLAKLVCEFNDRLCLPTKSEARRICTTARAKHCSGCAHERECTGREEAVVTSFFNNMAYRLSRKGAVSARIVPETIARRCYNIDAILESVNSAAKRMSGLSQTANKTQMLAQDYSAIAHMIREVTENDGGQRDLEGEKKLLKELSFEGFSFSSLSVYGMRSRRIYMRGVDPSASGLGEGDIVKCCERILGGRLSSPEFSIDGKEINASMHSLPVLRFSRGKYAIRSERDSTSGDCVCAFENEEGYHYTLVSDGMGSGKEAAQTSGISAAFLEKLLSGGCPMRGALELLNCFVRGADGECFVTVDLMEADMYTGKARFIKSGAAPSFIIRNGKLYRIHSKTVPVGIMRALDAEAVSFDLKVGDTVIMMSDGVTGSFEESPWLYDLLCEKETEKLSADTAAKKIAEEAVKNTGRDDDITVCVLKVMAA